MTGKAFFLQRLNDHVVYLKKIQATLEGKGDFTGTDCHDCKLGKWLYGEGPSEAEATSPKAKELFDSLLEPHQQFHEWSRAAIDKKAAGDEDSANQAITEMMKLSTNLVNTLLAMDKESS